MVKLNLFSKILLSLISISLIPLLVIGVTSNSLLTDILQKSLTNQALSCVAKINDNIDLLVSEYGYIIISLLSEDVIIRKSLKGDCSAAEYREIKEKIQVLAGRKNTSIYLLNSKCKVIFSNRELPVFYSLSFYSNQGIIGEANAIKNGFVIYPTNYTDKDSDMIVFSIARAIRDSRDRPIGYIIIEIFKKHILDVYDNISSNLNLEFSLIDREFTVIADLRYPRLDGTKYNSNFMELIRSKPVGSFTDKIKGKKSLVVFHKSKYTHLTALGVMPLDIVFESGNLIKLLTFLSCLVSLIICLILAFFLARGITNPVKNLVKQMKQVEGGNLSVGVNPKTNDEIGELGESFNKMVSRTRDLLNNIVEKQERIRKAEIKALQAQVNPHFLYNTLDSIKWLAKFNNVSDIMAIVTNLGKLLRNSINFGAEFTTVRHTLQIIESYIEIQKIRYIDKFDSVINVDPAILQYKVPTLLLQPIVENAIVHGLENKIGKGMLKINGYRKGAAIIFEVIDNGVGTDLGENDLLNKEDEPPETDSHIGLRNVHRRIKLYYGDRYGLTITSKPNKGTKVVLRMPLKEDDRTD